MSVTLTLTDVPGLAVTHRCPVPFFEFLQLISPSKIGQKLLINILAFLKLREKIMMCYELNLSEFYHKKFAINLEKQISLKN